MGSVKQIGWKELIRQFDGGRVDRIMPAYEFSGGRKFVNKTGLEYQPREVRSITISGATSMLPGTSIQLTAIAEYKDGLDEDVTASAIWSDDSSLVTVVAGLVTSEQPILEGIIATIGVSFQDGSITVIDSHLVSVSANLLGPDLVVNQMFTDSGWKAAGGNTVTDDGIGAKLHVNGNINGMFMTFRNETAGDGALSADLEFGATYAYKVKARVNLGDSIDLRIVTTGSVTDTFATVTGQSSVYYGPVAFVAGNPGFDTCRMDDCQNGEELWAQEAVLQKIFLN